VQAVLIRLLLAAMAFFAGWMMAKRSSWSSSLRDMYVFWVRQVAVLEITFGPRFSWSVEFYYRGFVLWIGQPGAALLAGILFADIKSVWQWLAVAFPAATVLVQLLDPPGKPW
jgi:hypothetical protein